MRQYLDMLHHILDHGELKKDRTGTGTRSVFGYQTRYDLREGFPLLTTKQVKFDIVVMELLWFLRGSTNINDNLKQHTNIWNPWANKNGELGPIYGHQWRKWQTLKGEEVDQITQSIEMIKKDPTSRRIIVSAWNTGEIDQMNLPPCHILFQFHVQDKYLDCQLYQRSADVALGVPFNIASYSLLLSMVAQECALQPRYFVHTFGDLHIYTNHMEGIQEQLKRKPKKPPRLKLQSKKVLDMQYEDIQIHDYQYDPFIPFIVAV